MDPEAAHGLALRALRLGLGPQGGPVTSPRLRTSFAGLDLPNPVGVAAGFDKNAVALRGLAGSGVGFAEIGAVTPRPQEGNPRPRLFRLPEDRAVINRFGFNNEGMEAVARRLERRPAGFVLGVNLGANKDSEDRAGDFALVLRRLGPLCDFATVNVSSPNTERLRDLQGREALRALLLRVMEARAGLPRPIPVLLKIAPDLSEAELADVAEVAGASGIAGLVATNTTLAREGLRGATRPRRAACPGRPSSSVHAGAGASVLAHLPADPGRGRRGHGRGGLRQDQGRGERGAALFGARLWRPVARGGHRAGARWASGTAWLRLRRRGGRHRAGRVNVTA
jgi:dihydroorotate dehydrogenase